MNIELKEILNNDLREYIQQLRVEVMEKIKGELEPHFEPYGTLSIMKESSEYLYIVLHFHNADTECYGEPIVGLSPDNLYFNDFRMLYERVELSPHDIFEDVGPYLGEIRVKEVQKKGEL